MVIDIDPASVRRERVLETVEHDLYRSAAELAVLGEVDSACDLVGVLNEEGAPTGQYGWSDRRLMVAWKASGKVPRGLSEQKVQQTADGVKEKFDDDPGKVFISTSFPLERRLQIVMLMVHRESYSKPSIWSSVWLPFVKTPVLPTQWTQLSKLLLSL